MSRTNSQNKNSFSKKANLGYYVPMKRICPFCKRAIGQIDHKEVEMIRKFTSTFGRINGARRTKACAKHQRLLAQAVKRARHLALLTFVN